MGTESGLRGSGFVAHGFESVGFESDSSSAFTKVGLSVFIGKIIHGLAGVPKRALQLGGSLSYYGLYLAISEDPTSLLIKIEGR